LLGFKWNSQGVPVPRKQAKRTSRNRKTSSSKGQAAASSRRKTSSSKKKSPGARPKARSRKAGSPRVPKVGTSPRAAAAFGGKGDFGAPESDVTERQYVSAAVKARDPGGSQPRSGADGQRTSGVGSRASGPGSGSGGDLDPDVIGLAKHGGLASAGPDRRAGADTTDGSPGKFASGSAARRGTGINAKRRERVTGSTVDHSGGDISTTGAGQGAASVTNPLARDDDSFAGEVSNDEAAGADNSASDDR
jgi:hypothetical protein